MELLVLIDDIGRHKGASAASDALFRLRPNGSQETAEWRRRAGRLSHPASESQGHGAKVDAPDTRAQTMKVEAPENKGNAMKVDAPRTKARQ